MPRMEPPPASLEAMVRSRPGASMPGEGGRPWVWVLLAIAAVATLAYLIGVHR